MIGPTRPFRPCRVIEDCVAGSSERAHEVSLRAMAYLQQGGRCSLENALMAMAAYTPEPYKAELGSASA
jgi:hypothetical protein